MPLPFPPGDRNRELQQQNRHALCADGQYHRCHRPKAPAGAPHSQGMRTGRFSASASETSRHLRHGPFPCARVIARALGFETRAGRLKTIAGVRAANVPRRARYPHYCRSTFFPPPKQSLRRQPHLRNQQSCHPCHPPYSAGLPLYCGLRARRERPLLRLNSCFAPRLRARGCFESGDWAAEPPGLEENYTDEGARHLPEGFGNGSCSVRRASRLGLTRIRRLCCKIGIPTRRASCHLTSGIAR